jgi:deoxyribonuclease-4
MLGYKLPLRIGLHTSISASLEKAALRAHELGANTFQIFSASPRMWRAGNPDPADVRLLQKARDRYDLHPLVIHDSYLINLASFDPVVREKSIAAFRGELERGITINADYLVMHPGNYKGQSVEEGIAAIVRGLAEAAHGLSSKSLTILLENTAGSGASIGSCFEELAVIRQLAESHMDIGIGYCLDTAHCLACGHYDVSSAAGLSSTVTAAQKVLGLENVRVIHSNDSKVPLASRVDRHQHIGEGYIGDEGFRRLLTHPKLRSKAFILETPVDEEGDERRNLEKLKTLCRKSSTTIIRSK